MSSSSSASGACGRPMDEMSAREGAVPTNVLGARRRALCRIVVVGALAALLCVGAPARAAQVTTTIADAAPGARAGLVETWDREDPYAQRTDPLKVIQLSLGSLAGSLVLALIAQRRLRGTSARAFR